MPKYRLMAEFEAKSFKAAQKKFTKTNPESLSIVKLDEEPAREQRPRMGFTVNDVGVPLVDESGD